MLSFVHNICFMDNNTKYCSVFNSDSSETVAYNTPLFPAYVVYGLLSSYPDYSSEIGRAHV